MTFIFQELLCHLFYYIIDHFYFPLIDLQDLYDLCASYLSHLFFPFLSTPSILTSSFSRICQTYFYLKAFALTIPSILISLTQISDSLTITSWNLCLMSPQVKVSQRLWLKFQPHTSHSWLSLPHFIAPLHFYWFHCLSLPTGCQLYRGGDLCHFSPLYTDISSLSRKIPSTQ